MPNPMSIAPQEGRALFGGDIQSYDAIRPPYPEQLYAFLRSTGALQPNCATLEIGAGNGLATRRLFALGANPLTALEPDSRFAPMLHAIATATHTDIQIIHSAFEEAVLPTGHYDLVAAATAFHWVDQAIGLAKVASVLKRGGYTAIWWNVFGDDDRADPFHEATYPILSSLSNSPSNPPNQVPFALDRTARLQAFEQTGQFEPPRCEFYKWTLVLDAAGVGALYGTFSGINRLPATERQQVLERLMAVADEQFGGRVERNMVTAVYVARRK